MSLSLSRFFLYASLLSIVVVIPSTFFPFIGGKYYFFRVAVEASLAFLLVHWAFNERGQEIAARFKVVVRHPLFIAVSAFAAAFLLAVIFANNPHAAFWSNYERGEGGFQMLHYYAFFILLMLLLTDEGHWKRMFVISAAAAGLMILYGIAAAALIPGFIGPYLDATGAPIAPTVLGRLFSSVRFQGSLGNPAYVAPYLVFSLVYLGFLFIRDRARSKPWHLAGYGLPAVFFLIFFVLSQTRGAFLGLIAAAVAFVVYLIAFHKHLRKSVFAVFVGLGVLGALLFGFRSTPFIKNLPGSRVLFIDFSESSAQTRLWTWGSAWQGIKERPIFGWGPENFSTVFDKYFNPNHFKVGQSSETWFDRAHSIILDYLAETGFVGFLAYLSMFVVFYWLFFTVYARRKAAPAGGEESRSLWYSPAAAALLLVAPVAYLVQGLILFDVLPIYMNVFMILAFAQFLFMKSDNAHQYSHERRA